MVYLLSSPVTAASKELFPQPTFPTTTTREPWTRTRTTSQHCYCSLKLVSFLKSTFKWNFWFHSSAPVQLILQDLTQRAWRLLCVDRRIVPWLCVDWGCAAADSRSLLHVQFHRLWDCRAPARKMSPGSTGQTSDCLQETLWHIWKVYRCNITDIITYIYLVFL